MRTIRTLTTGLATLALLAGSAVGVAAQSDADAMAPALVTGTLKQGTSMSDADQHITASPGTTTVVDGVTQTRGRTNTEIWEASDPRLTGTATYLGNWDEHPNAFLEASTRRLVNDEGSWTGSTTTLYVDGTVSVDAVVLTGEGAYEGLTAYLYIDNSNDPEPAVITGAIFDSELPAEPAAP